MMQSLFESGSERYQPDQKHTFNENPDYTLNQQRLASLVGLAAIGLPVILLAATFFGTLPLLFYQPLLLCAVPRGYIHWRACVHRHISVCLSRRE